MWFGYVHVDDVEGYVENLRLRFYLKRWQSEEGEQQGRNPRPMRSIKSWLTPTPKKDGNLSAPSTIERMANSIIRNSIREPIILHHDEDGNTELWDGNRRFYGTKHIMKQGRDGYADARGRVQWLPALVFIGSGDKLEDERIKHDILVECNFVEPEQIAWPAYIKAEQVYNYYEQRMALNPGDPVQSRVGQGRTGWQVWPQGLAE